jgi:hypothetical protein
MIRYFHHERWKVYVYFFLNLGITLCDFATLCVSKQSDRPLQTALLPPRSYGKPEAAAPVDRLLMMGTRMPETCWAVFKRQTINLYLSCVFPCIVVWWIRFQHCVLPALTRLQATSPSHTFRQLIWIWHTLRSAKKRSILLYHTRLYSWGSWWWVIVTPETCRAKNEGNKIDLLHLVGILFNKPVINCCV